MRFHVKKMFSSPLGGPPTDRTPTVRTSICLLSFAETVTGTTANQLDRFILAIKTLCDYNNTYEAPKRTLIFNTPPSTACPHAGRSRKPELQANVHRLHGSCDLVVRQILRKDIRGGPWRLRSCATRTFCDKLPLAATILSLR